MQWARIADVNYNRLNESLKFIEDIVRFSFENKILLVDIRKIRAQFLKVKQLVPVASIIKTRASDRDLGRAARFDHTTRRDMDDLLIANMTRTKESARILEEILRARIPRASALMKDIRFRLYDLEQSLYAVSSRTFDPSLYAIFDESFVDNSRFERDIRIMVRSGVTVVQLRIKHLPDRVFYRHAKKVMKVLANTKVVFIVNNRIDIALACKAHGVHLGQHDISVKAARELLGDHCIIGVSAHTPVQAKKAQRNGADYLGVGSVFPSATKRDSHIIGLNGLRRVCKVVDIPVVAVGGLNKRNYRSALRAGAQGIAVASYLFKGSLRKNIRSLTGKRH